MDDDGRVQAFDGRFVREPGRRQRRDRVAELGVMADWEGEEMRRSRLRLGLGLGLSRRA